MIKLNKNCGFMYCDGSVMTTNQAKRNRNAKKKPIEEHQFKDSIGGNASNYEDES